MTDKKTKKASIVYLIYSNIFVRYSKRFSRQNLYLYLGSMIEKYNIRKMKTILNIGAGGEVALFLRHCKLKFTEIDIDPERNPDYVMDMENMQGIRNDSVDAIICMSVLEHVRNPFRAVEEARRILKQGGIFIGCVPHAFPIHDEPHDYFRFTKYGILSMFKRFECLELKEQNSYLEAQYVMLLRLFVTGSKKEKIISVILFPLFIAILPLIAIGNSLVKNRGVTSGYIFAFIKAESHLNDSQR
ncbi:MAG: class I SAM-dependent methyltransferase [Candidatus Aenigmarchaeota archaeon]|nr:class I SAM-dependent methyltransferase [Candidatus Aenigmarchaeota archaeon]